jgi:hypothetical protein
MRRQERINRIDVGIKGWSQGGHDLFSLIFES